MIPAKPLELNLPATDDLTLNDLQLFEAGGFTIAGFKRFLSAYSNWTADDVGRLTVKEMKSVGEQIGEKLKDSAVPKLSSASS